MESDYGRIWSHRSGRVWIFVVRGELDAHLSSDLSRRVTDALAGSPDVILVDLEEVTFMDASAVGALVDAFRKAWATGAELRLVAPSAPATRLLRLTDTEEVFPIEEDLVTAYSRVA